jgi:hypothetical protein
MKPLLLFPFALVSCGGLSPAPSGEIRYRYVNTLDFGNDNTLDPVTVTGRDERDQREATRLDVTIGSATLTLRDPYDGSTGGAMYNPAVSLAKDGALIVEWSRIGEGKCRSEIVASPDGALTERKRSCQE